MSPNKPWEEILLSSPAGIGLVCGAFALCLSAVWLRLLGKYARSIIRCSLWTPFTFLLAVSIASFYVGAIEAGVVFASFTALYLFYIDAVQSRIPFAEVTLEASTAAVSSHAGVFGVAIASSLITTGWVISWLYATLPIFLRLDTHYLAWIVLACWLLSLYWTVQVIKHVIHVTTAGVAAKWWMTPEQNDATCGALTRACTSSLGSICLGSLFVAVAQPLRAIANVARNRSQRKGDCELLDRVENLTQYFNTYAFSEIALSGKAYKSASKQTFHRFVESGMTLIINQDLSGLVTSSALVCTAVLTALVGATLGPVELGATLGLIIGFIVAIPMLSVVDSAIATTYVLYAQHGTAMRDGHPELFDKFHKAAERIGRPSAEARSD